MKKYKIEVDITATAYIEVEANSEEEAIDIANDEISEKTVNELKQWEVTASVKEVTEQCENCCENLPPEFIYEHEGIKLCESCVEWAKENPKDFNFIFRKHS